MIPSAGSVDGIVIGSQERKAAVLGVIRSARRSLKLTIFRCSDFQVLQELARARQRGVRIQVLFTREAKGWRKQLTLLRVLVQSLGAEIRSYRSAIKYHAKYVVADDVVALISTSNLTRECFDFTCDFSLMTRDPEVVAGLVALFDRDWKGPRKARPRGLGKRLVVGPGAARKQILELFQSARHSIRVIDHKLSDPEVLDLFKRKQSEGIDVTVLGRGAVPGLRSHGRLFLIDGNTAVVGSLSLTSRSLDARREVAIMVRDAECVRKLNQFFENAAFRPLKEMAA
jgi:phosphatidylserine/phosphatidylglycerophosphate/cardiolipin synthase-like enzyme